MGGFFSRLFGGANADPARQQETALPPRLTKGSLFDVVGEASYQPALETICGGRGQFSAEHQCQAVLAPEAGNPHDPNAVQVLIQGNVVGYLSRAHAAEYRQRLGAISTSCDAKIVGGWNDGVSSGDFGVKLKIKWPPKLAKVK